MPEYRLVAGALVGMRTWRASVDPTVSLYSIYRDVTWPVRSPLEAVCLKFPRGLLNRAVWHHPPAAGCHCGIYGLTTYDEARLPATAYEVQGALDSQQFYVQGLVRAWGVATIGDLGFRARYARPQALVVPASADGRGRMLLEHWVGKLAARYEIDVIEQWPAELNPSRT